MRYNVFAVFYFVFAVRFLVLPRGFCFCREGFGFAVTVVGHRMYQPQLPQLCQSLNKFYESVFEIFSNEDLSIIKTVLSTQLANFLRK